MTAVTAFRISGLCLIATVVICASSSETASAQPSSKPSIVTLDDRAIPDLPRCYAQRMKAAMKRFAEY